MEIQRVHRVVQGAGQNAYESQPATRVASAELSPEQAQPVGVAPRVEPPPREYAGSLRQSQNASPSRQANLRPPTNPEGGFPAYDGMEDLMLKELAPEGCTPLKHRASAEHGVGLGSNTCSLSFSHDCTTSSRNGNHQRSTARKRSLRTPAIFAVCH